MNNIKYWTFFAGRYGVWRTNARSTYADAVNGADYLSTSTFNRYGEIAILLLHMDPMSKTSFEWDEEKNLDNQHKHGVSFHEAQYAFLDKKRIIAEDLDHTQDHKRYSAEHWRCTAQFSLLASTSANLLNQHHFR